MKIARIALTMAACALLLITPSAADPTSKEIKFAAPKRIHAGDALLGAGRLYPSPVLHDMNGDGRADIVVADLFGNVTVAHAGPDGTYAAETKLLAKSGKPLKFENW